MARQCDDEGSNGKGQGIREKGSAGSSRRGERSGHEEGRYRVVRRERE